MNNGDHYPFSLKPLPYAYGALEPHIDAQTVMLHHDKHLQTYVENLNKALMDYPQYHNWSLLDLVRHYEELPAEIRTVVRNNAGGVYNHNLYFDTMQTPSGGKPVGRLAQAIKMSFGSYEAFQKKMKDASLEQFGSGWAWLVLSRTGKLEIMSTPNQDTPFAHGACPITLVDVWEHAYYLKYQNRRGEYIDNWFPLIHWEQAEVNYLKCIKGRMEREKR